MYYELYTCTWMDGWMDGWMGGWMDLNTNNYFSYVSNL